MTLSSQGVFDVLSGAHGAAWVLGADRQGNVRARVEYGMDQACLSVCECEVFVLVAPGCANKEKTGEPVIAPNAVKAHIGTIMDKLRSRNRVELASYAISKRFAP